MEKLTDIKENIILPNNDIFINPITKLSLLEKLTSTPFETLFILDSVNKLMGVITPADLNLFNDYEVISINEVMNSNPKYITEENYEKQATIIFHDVPSIRIIPLLNQESQVSAFITKRKKDTFKLPFTQEEVDTVFKKHNQLDTWHHRSWLRNWGVTLDARRFLLRFIRDNFDENAKILDVACGTGLMSFYLADQGFNNIHGFDYSNDLISIAKELTDMRKMNDTIHFTVDNAFSPSFDVSDYNVAVFLGWVGCAAGFNAAFDENTPIHEIVDSLFQTYTFQKETYVIFDVYDDLSNYDIDKEKPVYRTVDYADLKSVFTKHGYELVDKCYDCNYKIKVVYVLRKMK